MSARPSLGDAVCALPSLADAVCALPSLADAVCALPSLAETQARIRALVTAPEGVEEALRAAGRAQARDVEGLLRGDRGLSASDRLAVYANAFFERLRGALAKDFPDLARALGDDAFHDLVKVYLMLHPPHRPSIRDAGASLAGFLREDEVAAPFRRRAPCAPDLAAFEWAQTEVFDAPDAKVLTASDLAALPPEAWPSLRLAPIPALRTLALAWPVQTLGDESGPAAAAALSPGQTTLRVWRYDERVRWREISLREGAALSLLASGASFGEICEELASEVGDAAAATEAASLLAGWVTDGCLCSVGAGCQCSVGAGCLCSLGAGCLCSLGAGCQCSVGAG